METAQPEPQILDEQISAAEAEVKAAQERLEALKQERFSNSDADEQTSSTPASAVSAASVPVASQTTSTTFSTAATPTGHASAAPAAAGQVYLASATYVPAKDHIAAGLLAVLLGAFGIHKFYLGYTTTGFIMLAVTVVGGVLTFGIAAAVMVVIGIVEGVIYITMSQSEFEETYVNHIHEWF